MKKIYTCMSVLCVAMTALLLVSCAGGKDYRNVIPGDAMMVFSSNPKSLAHKAQIGDFTQSVIYEKLDKTLGENEELSAEDRAYVLSLMADPAKTGLSMDHDCFMFMSGQNIQLGDFMGGMVFKVKDRKAIDKFAELISANAAPFKKFEDGKLTIYTDADKFNAVALAYDNNAFMVFFSGDNFENSRPVITKLFGQKKAESIMNNPHAESTFNGSYDMSMLLSYGSLMPMFVQQMGGSMTGMDFLNKMSVIVPVNFEKGRIVSDAKIYFDDKDAEKQYQEMSANMTLRQDLLKYLPEGSVAAFGGGNNGAKTYELLQKISKYGRAMGMVPQLKTFFDAIQGDVVLSFNAMSDDLKYPKATLMAEITDPAMMESVRGLLAMGRIQAAETAPGQYKGSMMGVTFWYGVRDKMFYASTDEGFITLLNEGGPSMHDKYGHLFKGNHGACVADFGALHSMLEKLVAANAVDAGVGIALPFISVFEDMYITSSAPTEANMVVNMTDKDKNSADVLYHAIENLVNMLTGMGC